MPKTFNPMGPPLKNKVNKHVVYLQIRTFVQHSYGLQQTKQTLASVRILIFVPFPRSFVQHSYGPQQTEQTFVSLQVFQVLTLVEFPTHFVQHASSLPCLLPCISMLPSLHFLASLFLISLLSFPCFLASFREFHCFLLWISFLLSLLFLASFQRFSRKDGPTRKLGAFVFWKNGITFWYSRSAWYTENSWKFFKKGTALAYPCIQLCASICKNNWWQLWGSTNQHHIAHMISL